MTYREFVDTAKAQARSFMEDVTDPTGDAPPHAVIETGKGGIVFIGIDPQFFSSRIGKRALVQLHLLPAIAEHRARKFAVVNGMISLKPGSPGFELVARIASDARQPEDPEDIPDFLTLEGHVENLAVSAFDPERHELWHAEVQRTAIAPPTLGEWFLVGEEADALSGPWIDPIREALR